jgi:hypothetical protein
MMTMVDSGETRGKSAILHWPLQGEKDDEATAAVAGR